jgi:predicted Fe-Mo cluster-binding NifX family protein
MDDRVDPRFGRAAGFLILDEEAQESRYIQNGEAQTMAQGAGIQAAEIISHAGASILLTGFVGPKAFQALTAAGITIVQNLENMTVREALDRYREGNVDIAESPNRRGHWR